MTSCLWPGWDKKAAAGKGMGVEVCRRPTTHGWDGRGMPQVAERQSYPDFPSKQPPKYPTVSSFSNRGLAKVGPGFEVAEHTLEN